MIIKNVRVFAEQGTFKEKDILIKAGRFIEKELEAREKVQEEEEAFSHLSEIFFKADVK